MKKKRLGVRTDVISYNSYVNHFFRFYKEFHNEFEWSESPKYVEFNTRPNAIELKLMRINLGNSIMKMTSFMTL